MFQPNIYTVESVTAGHPDKMCDQVSDAILDACLEQDATSRVAVETMGGHGSLFMLGEVTTHAAIDYEEIARKAYRGIGYDDNVHIFANITTQSPDIAQGVDGGGAGDQGIMYGYATDETPQFLPRGVVLVHELTKGLETLRKSGRISWLGPDGKAQVTLHDGRAQSVLVSCQHAQGVSQEEIRQTIIDLLIAPLLGDMKGVEVFVNPTGNFVRGGFEADTGLTGRKIMVDTYGGFIPHGGGCFSGKDPTKVDRSAAYMARFAAKNIAANGLAKQCLISVAYAIGRAEPLMVQALNENGEQIASSVVGRFDFRPAAIIERLGLRQPIYLSTAAYGHFGNPNFPWEQVEVW